MHVVGADNPLRQREGAGVERHGLPVRRLAQHLPRAVQGAGGGDAGRDLHRLGVSQGAEGSGVGWRRC